MALSNAHRYHIILVRKIVANLTPEPLGEKLFGLKARRKKPGFSNKVPRAETVDIRAYSRFLKNAFGVI